MPFMEPMTARRLLRTETTCASRFGLCYSRRPLFRVMLGSVALKEANLLKEAGKGWQLLIGTLCGFICLAFSALLVWLIYLVAWRNPHEYGKNDVFKPSTAAIFLLLLLVAVGFGMFAFRLMAKRRQNRPMMSASALRLWAMFFFLGSIVILIDATVKRNWEEAIHVLVLFPALVSMASAAFVLARRRREPGRVSQSKVT